MPSPPMTSSPRLSKRAQRIIRTREAASRNRMEQRAKMARLANANLELSRQTADLQRQNHKLRNEVRLMRALEADPKLLRRVLNLLR